MTRRSSDDAEYEPLTLEIDHSNDEDKDVLEFSRRTSDYTASLNRKYRALFIVSTVLAIFFASLAGALIVRLLQLHAAIRQYRIGFPTEFKDALSSIAYEEKVFTGNFALNRTSREVYHDVPEGQPRYFGDPAKYPEIDQNWKELLKRAS
jgi:hypothetical protein